MRDQSAAATVHDSCFVQLLLVEDQSCCVHQKPVADYAFFTVNDRNHRLSSSNVVAAPEISQLTLSEVQKPVTGGSRIHPVPTGPHIQEENSSIHKVFSASGCKFVDVLLHYRKVSRSGKSRISLINVETILTS